MGTWARQRARERRNREARDDALGALEQRQLADFLARAHATLRLWRLCEHKSCRRQRGCRGDVDACGTRCAKDRWAFVRHVLELIAAGRTRREAVRFAGRGNCKELRILFGFGEPLDMLVNEDGTGATLTRWRPASTSERNSSG